MFHLIFNIGRSDLGNAMFACVKRFTDRHAWSTCNRLVQKKNGK